MLDRALTLCAKPGRQVVFLTGAGISAESGIPTFRGKEGYWTVGSTVYHPQELATHEAFRRMPEDVWAWYLHRRIVCRAAAPNPAHLALVRCEEAIGDRFALVTQNVDGLHRRAGNQRLYEIHGDIDLARCSDECTPERFAVDDARVCPRCGAMARPHVLWFDESYDEPRFHLDTVRKLARATTLLVTVGTSAQTNLPWQVVELATASGAKHIDVNPDPNPFGERADVYVQASAGETIPKLVDEIISAGGRTRTDTP